MLHEGYFDNIYYRFWETNKDVSPEASVFAIHGLGGHCLWFDTAGDILNKKNMNLFSFDLPGFGQSKFPKGEISSYKEWIRISREVLWKYLNNFKVNSPVFVLGHSMGALIAILLNKNVKANGWILSVPGFEGHQVTFSFSKFLLPVLFKSIFGSKEGIFVPFGPELLTKNKETQEKIKNDPFRVVNLTANAYKHVYFLALKAKSSYDILEGPILMLVAGKDKICSNEAMIKFYDQIKVEDKSKKIYTNSLHDLFVEDEQLGVVEDIARWVKDRC